MPPVLEIGGLLIATSKLAFAIFFFVAVWLVGLLARRAGADETLLVRTAERSIIFGVIAARAAFVLEYFPVYRNDPLSVLYLWQPGYTTWAGIAAGASYCAWKVMRSHARVRSAAALVGGLLTPLVGFLFVISTMNQFTSPERLRAGMATPPLKLVDLEGNATSLAALRGKPVILNIWATWCYACRQEMPLLNRTYREWKASGLELVGMNLAEDAPLIRRFLKQVPVSYPIWLDPDNGKGGSSSPTTRFFERAGGLALPTTVFIDSNGIVQSIRTGELVAADLAEGMQRIGVRRRHNPSSERASEGATAQRTSAAD